MIDHEYEFTINGHIQVFFTQDSRIEFWDVETNEKIFSLDPTDLGVIEKVYNYVLTLWNRDDKEFAEYEKLHDGK